MSAEKLEFKTELKQLLHLITHSLYSNKEIFLRELISNASDAINKIKFDSLAARGPARGQQGLEDQARSRTRRPARSPISDNGIGMYARRDRRATRHDRQVRHPGVPGKPASSQDVQRRPDLIGQFGVGFYSAFMVADRVTVAVAHGRVARRTASAGSPTARASSPSSRRDKPDPRHRRHPPPEGGRQGVPRPWTLRSLVKKYSDFIEHPVVMDVEKKEGEQERRPSRRRSTPQGDLAAEQVGDQAGGVRRVLPADRQRLRRPGHGHPLRGRGEHRVQGARCSSRPTGRSSCSWGEPKWACELYIQRVLIMDHCEALLPPYLRFVQGVVDSADLPLNISREMLQQNPLLEQIKTNVVRSVLEAAGGDEERRVRQVRRVLRGAGRHAQGGAGHDWPTARGSPTCCCSSPPRPRPASSRPWPTTVPRCPPSRRRSTT